MSFSSMATSMGTCPLWPMQRKIFSRACAEWYAPPPLGSSGNPVPAAPAKAQGFTRPKSLADSTSRRCKVSPKAALRCCRTI